MSSPDKSVAAAHQNTQNGNGLPSPEIDDSVVLIAERYAGTSKRLRRATDAVHDTRNRKIGKTRPDIGMFLDTAAVNSDHEDTASDTDEEIDPET